MVRTLLKPEALNPHCRSATLSDAGLRGVNDRGKTLVGTGGLDSLWGFPCEGFEELFFSVNVGT